MYRSASRPIRGPSTTRRYRGFSHVPSDIGLFRVITIKISTVTARYRSVTVDFDHCRPLPGGISVVAAWLLRGKKKQEKEGKEGEPRTVLASNGEAASSAVGDRYTLAYHSVCLYHTIPSQNVPLGTLALYHTKQARYVGMILLVKHIEDVLEQAFEGGFPWKQHSKL
ncbi:hypothetical protein BHE74_00006350 [Ensete ventricosum]|nr:hypothetical protein BHE74_00006350 [Ensete ventricosum]